MFLLGVGLLWKLCYRCLFVSSGFVDNTVKSRRRLDLPFVILIYCLFICLCLFLCLSMLVSVCVCVCACVCLCVFHVYVSLSVCVCSCVYICTCLCLYLFLYSFFFLCLRLCLRLFVHVSASVSVSFRVSLCLSINAHASQEPSRCANQCVRCQSQMLSFLSLFLYITDDDNDDRRTALTAATPRPQSLTLASATLRKSFCATDVILDDAKIGGHFRHLTLRSQRHLTARSGRNCSGLFSVIFRL